jgi:hypothetical protein
MCISRRVSVIGLESEMAFVFLCVCMPFISPIQTDTRC